MFKTFQWNEGSNETLNDTMSCYLKQVAERETITHLQALKVKSLEHVHI